MCVRERKREIERDKESERECDCVRERGCIIQIFECTFQQKAKLPNTWSV